MKRYLLVAVMLITILPDLFGEIRNGYERDLPKLRTSLENLRSLLRDTPRLSYGQKRKLKAKIKSLMDMMAYSELTVKLLLQFREIAPDLYNEIDTLKDSKGRIIDVYVKFIPQEGAPFESKGMVSFIQSITDDARCVSEYGEGTVSVMIWILNNSLAVLSHEFGHLQYMVPNLVSYVKYYNRMYNLNASHEILGHRADDPSGSNAYQFQRRYRLSYARYLKADNALVPTFSLLNRTRRELTRREEERVAFVMNAW